MPLRTEGRGSFPGAVAGGLPGPGPGGLAPARAGSRWRPVGLVRSLSPLLHRRSEQNRARTINLRRPKKGASRGHGRDRRVPPKGETPPRSGAGPGPKAQASAASKARVFIKVGVSSLSPTFNITIPLCITMTLRAHASSAKSWDQTAHSDEPPKRDSRPVDPVVVRCPSSSVVLRRPLSVVVRRRP